MDQGLERAGQQKTPEVRLPVFDAQQFRNTGSEAMRSLQPGGETKFFKVVLDARGRANDAIVTTLDEEGGQKNGGVLYVEVGRTTDGSVTGEIFEKKKDGNMQLLSDQVLSLDALYEEVKRLVLPHMKKSGRNSLIGFVEAPDAVPTLH